MASSGGQRTVQDANGWPQDKESSKTATEILGDPVFSAFLLILTLWTLFVEDIRIALAPPGTKEYFAIATGICLGFFLWEMLLQALSDRSYLGLYFTATKRRPDDFCDCSGCINYFLSPSPERKKAGDRGVGGAAGDEDEDENGGSPTPVAAIAKSNGATLMTTTTTMTRTTPLTAVSSAAKGADDPSSPEEAKQPFSSSAFSCARFLPASVSQCCRHHRRRPRFYFCFLGSFWFWIDLISSVSLIFEIYRITINTYPFAYRDSQLATVALAVARAGRAGRFGARIGRLLSVFGVFGTASTTLPGLGSSVVCACCCVSSRTKSAQQQQSNSNTTTALQVLPGQSRLGNALTSLMTKRLVFGVSVAVVVIPFVSFTIVDTTGTAETDLLLSASANAAAQQWLVSLCSQANGSFLPSQIVEETGLTWSLASFYTESETIQVNSTLNITDTAILLLPEITYCVPLLSSSEAVVASGVSLLNNGFPTDMFWPMSTSSDLQGAIGSSASNYSWTYCGAFSAAATAATANPNIFLLSGGGANSSSSNGTGFLPPLNEWYSSQIAARCASDFNSLVLSPFPPGSIQRMQSAVAAAGNTTFSSTALLDIAISDFAGLTYDIFTPAGLEGDGDGFFNGTTAANSLGLSLAGAAAAGTTTTVGSSSRTTTANSSSLLLTAGMLDIEVPVNGFGQDFLPPLQLQNTDLLGSYQWRVVALGLNESANLWLYPGKRFSAPGNGMLSETLGAYESLALSSQGFVNATAAEIALNEASVQEAAKAANYLPLLKDNVAIYSNRRLLSLDSEKSTRYLTLTLFLAQATPRPQQGGPPDPAEPFNAVPTCAEAIALSGVFGGSPSAYSSLPFNALSGSLLPLANLTAAAYDAIFTPPVTEGVPLTTLGLLQGPGGTLASSILASFSPQRGRGEFSNDNLRGSLYNSAFFATITQLAAFPINCSAPSASNSSSTSSPLGPLTTAVMSVLVSSFPITSTPGSLNLTLAVSELAMLTASWRGPAPANLQPFYPSLEFAAVNMPAIALSASVPISVDVHFDLQPNRAIAAVWNMFLTLLIVFVLIAGALLFSYDVQTLVLTPMEALMEAIRKLGDDPFGQQQQQQQRQRKQPQSQRPATAKTAAAKDAAASSAESTAASSTAIVVSGATIVAKETDEAATPMVLVPGATAPSDPLAYLELQALLRTLTNISALLKMGFGSHGAAAITRQLNEAKELDPILPGLKTAAIYATFRLPQAPLISSCLGSEYVLLLNAVADIAHYCVTRHGGVIISNSHDSLVVCWPIPAPPKELLAATDFSSLPPQEARRRAALDDAYVKAVRGIADASLAACLRCVIELARRSASVLGRGCSCTEGGGCRDSASASGLPGEEEPREGEESPLIDKQQATNPPVYSPPATGQTRPSSSLISEAGCRRLASALGQATDTIGSRRNAEGGCYFPPACYKNQQPHQGHDQHQPQHCHRRLLLTDLVRIALHADFGVEGAFGSDKKLDADILAPRVARVAAAMTTAATFGGGLSGPGPSSLLGAELSASCGEPSSCVSFPLRISHVAYALLSAQARLRARLVGSVNVNRAVGEGKPSHNSKTGSSTAPAVAVAVAASGPHPWSPIPKDLFPSMEAGAARARQMRLAKLQQARHAHHHVPAASAAAAAESGSALSVVLENDQSSARDDAAAEETTASVVSSGEAAPAAATLTVPIRASHLHPVFAALTRGEVLLRDAPVKTSHHDRDHNHNNAATLADDDGTTAKDKGEAAASRGPSFRSHPLRGESGLFSSSASMASEGGPDAGSLPSVFAHGSSVVSSTNRLPRDWDDEADKQGAKAKQDGSGDDEDPLLSEHLFLGPSGKLCVREAAAHHHRQLLFPSLVPGSQPPSGPPQSQQQTNNYLYAYPSHSALLWEWLNGPSEETIAFAVAKMNADASAFLPSASATGKKGGFDSTGATGFLHKGQLLKQQAKLLEQKKTLLMERQLLLSSNNGGSFGVYAPVCNIDALLFFAFAEEIGADGVFAAHSHHAGTADINGIGTSEPQSASSSVLRRPRQKRSSIEGLTAAVGRAFLLRGAPKGAAGTLSSSSKTTASAAGKDSPSSTSLVSSAHSPTLPLPLPLAAGGGGGGGGGSPILAARSASASAHFSSSAHWSGLPPLAPIPQLPKSEGSGSSGISGNNNSSNNNNGSLIMVSGGRARSDTAVVAITAAVTQSAAVLPPPPPPPPPPPRGHRLSIGSEKERAGGGGDSFVLPPPAAASQGLEDDGSGSGKEAVAELSVFKPRRPFAFPFGSGSPKTRQLSFALAGGSASPQTRSLGIGALVPLPSSPLSFQLEPPAILPSSLRLVCDADSTADMLLQLLTGKAALPPFRSSSASSSTAAVGRRFKNAPHPRLRPLILQNRLFSFPLSAVSSWTTAWRMEEQRTRRVAAAREQQAGFSISVEQAGRDQPVGAYSAAALQAAFASHLEEAVNSSAAEDGGTGLASTKDELRPACRVLAQSSFAVTPLCDPAHIWSRDLSFLLLKVHCAGCEAGIVARAPLSTLQVGVSARGPLRAASRESRMGEVLAQFEPQSVARLGCLLTALAPRFVLSVAPLSSSFSLAQPSPSSTSSSSKWPCPPGVRRLAAHAGDAYLLAMEDLTMEKP